MNWACNRVEVPAVDEKEAARLASEFAGQHGYDVAGYSVDPVKVDGRWEVRFSRGGDAKSRPGDFFVVRIDDRSGLVERIVHGK